MAVKKENKAIEETVDKTPLDSLEARRRNREEKVTLVYIGPSLPAGWLKSNSVFTGTMPEIEKELEAVLGKYPAVKKLFVPIGQLADKKEKARTPGNILNKYYSDIVSDSAAHERKV